MEIDDKEEEGMEKGGGIEDKVNLVAKGRKKDKTEARNTKKWTRNKERIEGKVGRRRTGDNLVCTLQCLGVPLEPCPNYYR
ncbi:hypothetical protein Pcinc_038718 [Petrolisthes cinctipes]|uniref:Uncharacterized protein n=1 Tax=Petrolisthes cinctipes TaxID=88211 RepID=A0AAE1BQ30_PETCI|nr:hypothetical protein Pcinc_038718 [Petrolisthes cinctipes]